MKCKKLIGALRKGVYILFPPHCPCCGGILAIAEYEEGFCADCKDKIRYIGEPACKVCGKPLKKDSDEICYDCGRVRHLFLQSKAVYVYTGGMKTAMYGLKYGNRRGYGRVFAKDMARIYGRWMKRKGIDLIVPVPMNGAKRRERGYDQAAVLARALSDETGIPFSGNTLIRTRRTRPMKELNGSERRKNLKNAFKMAQSGVKSKRVLIVDDIFTTGSTLDACAEVLLAGGAAAVFGMTAVVGEGI